MHISVPSWVVPGTYAENLRFLDDKEDVDGVELLFFLYDSDVRDLFLRERDELRARSDRFAYTVHLPDRLEAAHEELVEGTADLARSWVVHPPRDGDPEILAALIGAWRERYGDRFYLENTVSARFEALRALLPDAPLCLDTGHLLLEGKSPAAFAAANAGAIREIHLHGLGDGHGIPGLPYVAPTDGRLSDHRVFRADAPWFLELKPFLRSFAGIANVEVFSWAEAEIIIRRIGSDE